jgi:hypothetical protein
MANDDRLRKTVWLTVALTVPRGMDLAELKRDVRTGIGFGDPEVSISYVTFHPPEPRPPAITDVHLPPGDDEG